MLRAKAGGTECRAGLEAGLIISHLLMDIVKPKVGKQTSQLPGDMGKGGRWAGGPSPCSIPTQPSPVGPGPSP